MFPKQNIPKHLKVYTNTEIWELPEYILIYLEKNKIPNSLKIDSNFFPSYDVPRNTRTQRSFVVNVETKINIVVNI